MKRRIPHPVNRLAIFIALSIGATVVDARPLYGPDDRYPVRQSHTSVAEKSSATGTPFVDYIWHNVANFIMSMKNNGIMGPDTYTGAGVNGDVEYMEFPLGSTHAYPTPKIVVGGIVGRDTLVSYTSEFWPPTLEAQIASNERIIARSINDTGSASTAARSEQDITCVYYDTLSDSRYTPQDYTDNRAHVPLNLKVRQTSYVWSFEFAEDFMIIDYNVSNVGDQEIRQAYLGIQVQGGFYFDIVGGYKESAKAYTLAPTSCEFTQNYDLFWTADNDGNPEPGASVFADSDPTSVTAIKILGKPVDFATFNFNWWEDIDHVYGPEDWAPRRAGTLDEPFRDYGGHLGTPTGDRNLYYTMASNEFDYDIMYTALDHTDEGWLPPPHHAALIAGGPGYSDHNHYHAMTAVGPMIIPPKSSVTLTIAYVMGENFHRNPAKVFDPQNPDDYIEDFNFDDLIKNTSWASWVYDNPGVDTDDDGYFGEYYTCPTDSTLHIDTMISHIDSLVAPPDTYYTFDSTYTYGAEQKIYYTGDGVPDYRAATPPPAPKVRYEPAEGELRIKWDGLLSETTPDIFSNELDFEGYRVYLGLERTSGGLSLQASYDIEDYTQHYYSPSGWVILRKPFSLREVQVAYGKGSSTWNPLIYNIDNPLRVGDSLFYFVTQDWNQDLLTDTNGIHKLYPDEPYPHTLELEDAFTNDTFIVDSLTGDTTFYPDGELTPDGKFFKYFQYGYNFKRLLPSQKYYVSVTAFDFGSQEASLPYLETNPVTTALELYALDRVPQDDPNALDVIVYPNPYRIDQNYRDLGYESRGEDQLTDERAREIHFVNLPPRCTIRIYTLDGDLVHRLEHDEPAASASSMHETWNLISRNTQLVVSGIYYWLVETPDGRTQVGKLVLIL